MQLAAQLVAVIRYEDGGPRAVKRCLRGHSCGVSSFGVSRFMPCCVEWVRFVVAYLRFVSREDPPPPTWTMSSRLGCADRAKVLFRVSCGDRPRVSGGGFRSLIFSLCDFLFSLSVLVPLHLLATLSMGKSTKESDGPPLTLVHVCLERQRTGVLSGRDHSSHLRRKVTGITFLPLSFTC